MLNYINVDFSAFIQHLPVDCCASFIENPLKMSWQWSLKLSNGFVVRGMGKSFHYPSKLSAINAIYFMKLILIFVTTCTLRLWYFFNHNFFLRVIKFLSKKILRKNFVRKVFKKKIFLKFLLPNESPVKKEEQINFKKRKK